MQGGRRIFRKFLPPGQHLKREEGISKQFSLTEVEEDIQVVLPSCLPERRGKVSNQFSLLIGEEGIQATQTI